MDAAAIEHDRPVFLHNINLLFVSAFFTALFTALRGGLFTLCCARLNVRIRRTLMQSLLQQEVRASLSANRIDEQGCGSKPILCSSLAPPVGGFRLNNHRD